MFTGVDKNVKPRTVEGNWYIGVVIDNEDPEKLQRVKVRSHDLHRGIPDKALPWAIKCSEPWQGNTPHGVGAIAIPAKGAKVLFRQQDNSLYYPMYMGIPNTEDIKIDELVSEDYPHVYASIDRTGNLWWINTKKDHIKLVHVSGTSVSIDGKGHIKVEVADNKIGPDATEKHNKGVTLDIIGNVDAKVSGDVSVQNQGKTDIISGGETKIHSSPHVDIAAGRIDLNTNSPSSPSSPTTPENRERPKEDIEPPGEENKQY